MALKLNIGCGGDLREDYVNIDMHGKELIKERYGLEELKGKVVNLDIFNLPYEDESVDEIMCLGFLEHLSFADEGKFLREVQRVLKPAGVFLFTVPDFDNLVKQWQEAEDNFTEFYQLGTDEHWFGNYSRTMKNKWGYLTAFIFGNQYGEGQFHRNAYTKKKVMRIMEMINFDCTIFEFYFKDTEALMLNCIAIKRDE